MARSTTSRLPHSCCSDIFYKVASRLPWLFGLGCVHNIGNCHSLAWHKGRYASPAAPAPASSKGLPVLYD